MLSHKILPLLPFYIKHNELKEVLYKQYIMKIESKDELKKN